MPISSVILSSQRVDLKEAIYDAEKGKDRGKEAAVNPLVRSGQKLIPSVTRSFTPAVTCTSICKRTGRRRPATNSRSSRL